MERAAESAPRGGAGSEGGPLLSLIIPTRERAQYLRSSLTACLASSDSRFEVVVLDNASRDDTGAVVAGFDDPRLRYVRSDRRLSMRDNFERGIELTSGRYLGFIGDDDAIFPYTPQSVIELFDAHRVEAVSAARAHYAWPDLRMPRAGMGLVPRWQGVEVRRSRDRLRNLLSDNNYYDLPCVYHGFVARSAIDRVKEAQGRFFVSSIVDAASSVALGMLDVEYAYSRMPLVINGGSSRSNGASQFGGGSAEEQANWKVEDDLGYLPGFDDAVTVAALIIESAARSAQANAGRRLDDILDPRAVRQALLRELEAREAKGRDREEALRMFDSVGLPRPRPGERSAPVSGTERMRRRARQFIEQLPVDLKRLGVSTVDGAARVMTDTIQQRRTGMLHDPVGQLRAARRMAG